MWLYSIAAALLLVHVSADNVTASDECPADGIWSGLLEEWALSAPTSDRHGRIMALPPAQGYYVTERIDHPPPHGPHHHRGPHPHGGPHGPMHGPPHGGPHGPFPYDEWHQSPPPAGTKIVNRPPNPYKDKFKPSYQSPPPSQQIPAHVPPAAGLPPAPPAPPHSPLDRIGEAPPPPPPPRKQVSETDLYLLSAIEKLVWRVDIMEKRLRKMEESMLYLISESEPKPEPCVENFTRVGGICYHFSAEAADWKSANLRCRKLRANLLELNDEGERRTLQAAMLVDKRIKGLDIWTGGLNPGLLWIWSHSARPVVSNSTASNNTVTVVGEGRCLAWIHDPALKTYVYRGQDCALRHRFICEKPEDEGKLSNEIERAARMIKEGHTRKPKIMWSDENAEDSEQTL